MGTTPSWPAVILKTGMFGVLWKSWFRFSAGIKDKDNHMEGFARTLGEAQADREGEKMNLTVNGKKTAVTNEEPLSIAGLLDELNVADPLYVTVELNGDIMERINFNNNIVKDGDEVEFLYFMGGGAE